MLGGGDGSDAGGAPAQPAPARTQFAPFGGEGRRLGEEAEEENDQQEKEQTDADPPRADEGETSATVNGSNELPLDEQQLSIVQFSCEPKAKPQLN